MRYGTADQRGFTVIEVLFTVVLLGILLGVSVPDLRNFHARHELRVAAQQMASDLRDLEQQAAIYRAEGWEQESGLFTAEFSPDDNRYRLTVPNHPSSWVTLPNSVQLVGTNIHEGDIADQNTFIFSYRGTPDVGGTVTLQSRLTEEDLYVIIAPVTGRVRVSSSPPGGDQS